MAKGLLSAAQVNAEVDTALNTAVPLTPTANSLNDILSKADGANTFDNTTDSLEAIADAMATPTNITGGTITTVTTTTTATNLTNAATAGDLTAAMKTSVNAEVDTALNTAVPLTPTANSLNDILSKADGANTFDNTTDSLEAIRDKVDTLPTAGAVVSTASATATGVIVQDGVAGTPNVVDVISPATANTFGSWVALDAAASADCWLSHIIISSYDPDLVTTVKWCMEIGTGAAGSEAAKTRFSGSISAAAVLFAVIPLPIPIKVASGTAISARASTSVATGVTFWIGLSFYQTLET